MLKCIIEKVQINHNKKKKDLSMLVQIKIINFKNETFHLEIIVKQALFFGEKCFTFVIYNKNFLYKI